MQVSQDGEKPSHVEVENKTITKAKGLVGHVSACLADDMQERFAILKESEHGVMMNASPINILSSDKMPSKRTTVVPLTNAASMLKALTKEESTDLLLVPLLTWQHQLSDLLALAQVALQGGGWCLFNTLVQGSFSGVSSRIKPDDPLELLTVADIIHQLASIQRHQPIIDCRRFELHYTSQQQVISDCQQLMTSSDGFVTSTTHEIEPNATGYAVPIEIAHTAIYFEKASRHSMRSCGIPVVSSHDQTKPSSDG